MPEFRLNPALTELPTDGSGFVQQIRMEESRKTLAIARWHAPPVDHGVVQILEMHVDPQRRRQGLGNLLMRELIKQTAAYHRSRGVRFRRIWVSVEQKSQVIARAFLTQQGFHHVATIGNLLIKQDALIYVKGMD